MLSSVMCLLANLCWANIKGNQRTQGFEHPGPGAKSGVSPDTVYRIEQGMKSRFITSRKLSKA